MPLLLLAVVIYIAIFIINDSVQQAPGKKQRGRINPYKKKTQIQDYSHHGERCFGTNTKGENELLGLLERGLNPKEYYIFNNLIIPSAYGKTAEIDHLVISSHGIFVIENKDWAGYLFASSHGKTWTQSLSKDRKNHYANPLHQNYGHIKSLERLLPFVDSNKIFSVVAFSRRGKFKTSMPPHVFYYDLVVPYIKNEKGRTISTQRVLMTIGRVSQICQVPPADHKKHISNIQSQYKI